MEQNQLIAWEDARWQMKSRAIRLAKGGRPKYRIFKKAGRSSQSIQLNMEDYFSQGHTL